MQRYSTTPISLGVIVFCTTFLLCPASSHAEELPPDDAAQTSDKAPIQRQNIPLEKIPYKYIGNVDTLKFHRPRCPFAKVMNPRRMCLFRLRKDAIDSSMKPCRYCLPPIWTSVSGKLLNRDKPISSNTPKPSLTDQTLPFHD